MRSPALVLGFVATTASCSEGIPEGRMSNAGAIAAAPSGGVFYSLCESSRPVIDRMVGEAAHADRIVLTGWVVPGSDPGSETRRFRSSAFVEELPVRRVAVRIGRILHDPRGRLTGASSPMRMLVADRSRGRRIDSAGGVMVPASEGADSVAPDRLARSEGDGAAFLVEVIEGEMYIADTAIVESGRIVGPDGSLAADEFAGAVLARRAAGGR